MRVIIVDPSRLYMTTVRRFIAAALPAVEVTEYDAEQQGPPGPDFDWECYDCAILSHELGDGPSGLAWLRRHAGGRRFPLTVFVAAAADDYLAVDALKAGATEYLRRADVCSDRLLAVLRAAAARPPAADGTQRLGDPLGELTVDARTLHPLHDTTGHRFLRLIGQGGFSRVYLAERLGDQVPVVLKVIDTQQIREPAIVKRFVREAEIMAGIDDPHVVKVYDRGFTPEYGYIAMEFFRQGDLKRRIEQGATLDDSCCYLRDLACGLRAIHTRGVVHRDIKPGNIMFRDDDSLALADFGISRRASDSDDLTLNSGILGTPSYISPEQACGRRADERSDLYSAGVVFYELLTGRKPYRAETADGVVYQHLHAPVPRLPERLVFLQPILDLLLAKDPDDRFESADELLQTLEAWLPAPFLATPVHHLPAA